MKFMQYDGEDTAQLQLKLQAAKFYEQTKAGWDSNKVDIPDDASPLDIVNITINKMSNDGLTPTEFKQLTDLAHLKQQVLALQPKCDDASTLTYA